MEDNLYKDTLISVIMPVYNDERYVLRAVESILAQTYTNFEFLIIDDGSTDNSYQKLQEIDDSRVELYKQNNRGIATSLNRGISLSRGNLIARMDADDISHIQRFDIQNKVLNDFDFDIVTTAASYFHNAVPSLSSKFKYNEITRNLREIIKEELELANPCFHGSIMMRREVVEKIGGYNNKLKHAQGLDLYLRAIRNGYKLGYIDAELFAYYVSLKNPNIYSRYLEGKRIRSKKIPKYNDIKFVYKCLSKAYRVSNYFHRKSWIAKKTFMKYVYKVIAYIFYPNKFWRSL